MVSTSDWAVRKVRRSPSRLGARTSWIQNSRGPTSPRTSRRKSPRILRLISQVLDKNSRRIHQRILKLLHHPRDTLSFLSRIMTKTENHGIRTIRFVCQWPKLDNDWFILEREHPGGVKKQLEQPGDMLSSGNQQIIQRLQTDDEIEIELPSSRRIDTIFIPEHHRLLLYTLRRTPDLCIISLVNRTPSSSRRQLIIWKITRNTDLTAINHLKQDWQVSYALKPKKTSLHADKMCFLVRI